MFLKVKCRALNQFDKRNGVVVVLNLIEAREGLNLDSNRIYALPPPKVIRVLQSILHNGESANIFADLIFKYFLRPPGPVMG